jgi:hypothetical protein
MTLKWRTATGAISLALALLFATVAYGQPTPGPGIVSFIRLIDTPDSYDGANNQCLLVDETNQQVVFDSCSGTPGETIIFDLGDDDVNESTAIEEVAVTGDTHSIFSEPAPDKLLINLANPVPKATALATDPSNCASGEFATGVNASGTAEGCASPGTIEVTGDTNNIFGDPGPIFTIDASQPWLTATALAANGANCSAGQYARGVDTAGAAENCTADDDVPEAADYSNLTSGNGIGQAVAGTLTVDLVTPGADADSSVTNSPSGLQFIAGDLSFLRGCSDGQVLKWAEGTDRWECQNDASGEGGGGSSIILDLLDDDDDESNALGEVAITGDTHSIFSESADDKLLINLANPVPTATALEANGANCSAGEYPLGVDASGATETCTADDDVPEAADYSNLVAGNGLVRTSGTLDVDLELVGSDGDSVNVSSPSGLEFTTTDGIHQLTMLRGCEDNDVMRWGEEFDTWNCETPIQTVDLHTTADMDGDSSTVAAYGGLEIVNDDLTLIRGCADEEVLKWEEDGDFWACAPESGGGDTPTLDEVFDAGTGVIDGAIVGTKTFKVGSATGYFEFGDDAVNGPTMTCTDDGAGCHHIIDIPASKDLKIYGNGVLFENLTAAGVHTYSNAGRPALSKTWVATEMTGDGTDCDTDPTAETFNSVPGQFGVRCAMGSSETDGFIYMLKFDLPDNFDKTADATFSVKANLITDGGAATFHGRISIDCVGVGELPGTWGTAPELDLTLASGDIVGDEVRGTGSVAVDTDTTDSNCNPRDSLYARIRVCDTDATPSTGCTSNAGFENDLTFTSLTMEYKVNSRTQ